MISAIFGTPTMKTTMNLVRLLACALIVFVTACGGDDAPPEPSRIKTIETTTPKKVEGGDTKGTKPIPDATQPGSITEQKNRKKAEYFKKRLSEARISEDLGEVLADIAATGADMKRLAPEVRKCLENEDVFVREETLRALAAIDPGGCRPYLEKGLKDAEEDVRRAAVLAWRKAPIKDLSPLFAHLEDEIDPEVQRAISIAVREHGQDFHVGQVVRTMEEIAVSATKPLLEFLVAQKAVKHVDVFVDFLERSDPSVRAESARGLGELGVKTKPVLEALTRGLEDEGPRVRQASCLSLRKLTNKNFGFNVDGKEDARESSISAWREWIKNSK
jgi:HEAT repeat protein